MNVCCIKTMGGCQCNVHLSPYWWELTGITRAWICVLVVSPVVPTVSSGKYCYLAGSCCWNGEVWPLLVGDNIAAVLHMAHYASSTQSNTVTLSKLSRKYKRNSIRKMMVILLTHPNVQILTFSQHHKSEIIHNDLNSQEFFCLENN